MLPSDYSKLLEDVDDVRLAGATSLGFLGLTTTTLNLVEDLIRRGMRSMLTGIYAVTPREVHSETLPVYPLEALERLTPAVLVIGADEEKEDLLLSALPHIKGCPRILLAGYGHYRFRDAGFQRCLSALLVPSFANGYPYSLVHLYQCLKNASRLALSGVVAEFGMCKGGTTMFLSRAIEHFGQTWKVVAFDTFSGFPPPRSPLDMYHHAGCVFGDVDSVRRCLSDRNVEVVAGDIVDTRERLRQEDIVVSFVDTDNYTPAIAALEVLRERTVVGGAIVFDHFTGVDRFRYTLGERVAGFTLLDDARYFNLHGTGVFLRQREQ